MSVPDGFKFLEYDAALMVKGQQVGHWFAFDKGEDLVEVGKIHCKPTKSGPKWVKFDDEPRPHSMDLNPKDYLDLWCFLTPAGIQEAAVQEAAVEAPAVEAHAVQEAAVEAPAVEAPAVEAPAGGIVDDVSSDDDHSISESENQSPTH